MTLPTANAQPVTNVTCGTCRKCCTDWPLISLTVSDDPRHYLTKIVGGRIALQHKANGDCVYLGEAGCLIWGRHPEICREFDCAAFAVRYDEGAFRYVAKQQMDRRILKQGRKLLAARRRAR